MATLKPFVINLNDLLYLLEQVNFVPLFDGPANSNGIVNFDPLTMDAWDAKGNQVWNAPEYDINNVLIPGTGEGSYQGVALDIGNVGLLGSGFPHVSSPIGVRDVSGLHNNLFGDQAFWGTVDVPFRRDIRADFTNYVTSPGADYTPGANVIDLMPRIISRTITTAGVNLLRDGAGAFVEWDSALYVADAAYAAVIDAAGVDTAQLVEGAKIVAPVTTEIALLDANGQPLIWHQSDYLASAVYAATLGVYGNLSFGGLFGSETGGELVDGGAIYYQPVIGTFVQIPGQTYQPSLLVYKQLVDGAGIPFTEFVEGEVIVTTLESSGYGLLETLGHVDFQNPGTGEYFIGSENPGVAPVNSWFGIFGQFFDHGLDLIGKGGNGKITIQLETTDPLYRAPGTNGPGDPGNTAITVTRATIAGTDANGDPNYVNHTSPFIDQSQTYGSVDQITQLLRKWESTDGGATYHAGIELFDGQTLVDAWERRWPDGTTTWVHDTLPTLNELRQHVIETGRDALTWEDVLDYRNRDAAGKLSGGNSGHALILDMNPHFDGATGPGEGHISAEAIAKLNAAAGTSFTTATFTVAAIMPFLNPDFSINAPTPEIHEAVSDILMDSVGDHYIAGDGRVNENFGLTSIHHVFHEEHNYQVENLKTWIYAHDANNPGLVDTHEQLHNWQIDTGNGMDAEGNFLNADGSIAWDADKMFEATKLVVEMEYQHAAVDQYARTVTPRIQEFVGYSTGVDATVSLEYAQVAFRFGHSTIRETIDTVDPSGWMLGNVTRYALEKAFLAPQTFAEEGIAAITLGLSRQQMNEVDEFVTPALTQGLLDQPLDLAAINIARGRDLGIPTLNDFREGISLARYTSWDDFGKNMIHPESLVNFIAAYSFDGDVAKANAIMGLYDGTLADGDADALGFTAADALAFMLNNPTDDADLNVARDGFNHIDSWIGGLAEAHVPGGLLGETFDAVFVAQIQSLMDGDRFYYLYRLFGTQIHEEVNNGQFKDIVERNTGLSHLNGSIFAYADKYYDFNRNADGTLPGEVHEDLSVTPLGADDVGNHFYSTTLDANPGLGIFSDGGASTVPNGDLITLTASDFVRADVVTQYIRDVRPELNPAQVHTVEGTPTSGADSHEVIVATERRDFIHARGGDDTVYGEGGDDFIFGDGGVDRLYGGDGNDMIDTGEGPDLADGGSGKDIIYGRGSGSEVGGFDQLVGGSGNDLVIGGEGIDKLSGGSGDDIIYGDGLTNPEMGNTDAFTHGGDGNDYIDTGASGDLLYGEEGDDYMVGGIDQDLIQGGQGDDILRPGSPSQAINGGPDEVIGDNGGNENIGFDLMDLSDYAAGGPGVTADLATQANPLVAIDGQTPFPAWFQMEGVIGTSSGDTLTGDSAGDATAAFSLGANWLIGGSGDDTIRGNGGNDLIIGGSIRLDSLIGTYVDAETAGSLVVGSSAWLAEAMHTGGTAAGYGNDSEDAYSGASNRALGDIQANGLIDAANASGVILDKHFTEMLRSRMFKDVMLGDGGDEAASNDVAVFSGNRADYDVTKVLFTDAWGTAITAYRIVHARNNIGVDANGVALPDDGTDLVVGVESFRFADVELGLLDILNSPPSIVEGDAISVLVAENTAAGTLVQALTALDPDGPPLTWSITAVDGIAGTGDGLFAIDPITGAISLTGPAPDYEALPEGGTARVLTVAVTDGFSTDTIAVTVDITNVDEAATGALRITGYTATNTSATLTALNTLSDPDGYAEAIPYQWQQLVAGNWVDIVDGNNASLVGQVNTTVRVTSSYIDAFGLKTVNSAETAFVTGSSGNNTLTGTTGDDFLIGLGGRDTLNGGDGNDLLDGGAGNDTMNGGLGNDIYVVNATGDVVVEGADAGIDTVRSSVTRTLGDNFENLSLTGTGGIFGTGNALDNVITGNGGNNTLRGNGGNDTLDGGGNASASGDTAAFSGTIAEYQFSIDALGRVVVTDTVVGPRDGADTLVNIERVNFGGTTSTLRAGTDAAIDDADAITATNTREVMVGGAGADTFVFATTAASTGVTNRDTIGDFQVGDKIDLSAIDASSALGNGVFNFLGELNGIAGNGDLGYRLTTDANGNAITVVEGNVNTNVSVDIQFVLLGHHALTADNFIL